MGSILDAERELHRARRQRDEARAEIERLRAGSGGRWPMADLTTLTHHWRDDHPASSPRFRWVCAAPRDDLCPVLVAAALDAAHRSLRTAPRHYTVQCLCGWQGWSDGYERHLHEDLCPECRRVLVGVRARPLGPIEAGGDHD